MGRMADDQDQLGKQTLIVRERPLQTIWWGTSSSFRIACRSATIRKLRLSFSKHMATSGNAGLASLSNRRPSVQLDHLRLADYLHERSDPLRQLRSDVACWSTAATRAIRIRRA